MNTKTKRQTAVKTDQKQLRIITMTTLIIFITWIVTALIFFLLGRYSKKVTLLKKRETIDDLVEKIKAKPPIIKPGIIPFRTPEEIESEKSGDAALEKHWRESGIMEKLK